MIVMMMLYFLKSALTVMAIPSLAIWAGFKRIPPTAMKKLQWLMLISAIVLLVVQVLNRVVTYHEALNGTIQTIDPYYKGYQPYPFFDFIFDGFYKFKNDGILIFITLFLLYHNILATVFNFDSKRYSLTQSIGAVLIIILSLFISLPELLLWVFSWDWSNWDFHF